MGRAPSRAPGRTAPPGASASSGSKTFDGDAPPDRRAQGTTVVAVTQQDDLDYPGEHECPAERAARPASRSTSSCRRSAREWIAEARASRRDHVLRRRATSAAGLGETFLPGWMERATTLRGSRSSACAARVANGDRRGWAIREAYAARTARTDRIAGSRAGTQAVHLLLLPVAGVRGIDVLPTPRLTTSRSQPARQCVGSMHRDDPLRIRVAWWLPLGHTADGRQYLRRYYPSSSTVSPRTPDARMYASSVRSGAPRDHMRRRWTGASSARNKTVDGDHARRRRGREGYGGEKIDGGALTYRAYRKRCDSDACRGKEQPQRHRGRKIDLRGAFERLGRDTIDPQGLGSLTRGRRAAHRTRQPDGKRRIERHPRATATSPRCARTQAFDTPRLGDQHPHRPSRSRSAADGASTRRTPDGLEERRP